MIAESRRSPSDWKRLPKYSGLTAADITTEKTGSVNIAGGLNHAHNDNAHEEAVIYFSCIPQKSAGGKEGGDQGANDQQRGGVAARHIVVICAFHLSARNDAHQEKYGQREDDTNNINVHLSFSLSFFSAVKAR